MSNGYTKYYTAEKLYWALWHSTEFNQFRAIYRGNINEVSVLRWKDIWACVHEMHGIEAGMVLRTVAGDTPIQQVFSKAIWFVDEINRDPFDKKNVELAQANFNMFLELKKAVATTQLGSEQAGMNLDV